MAILKLDFFVEGAALCELQNHVCSILIFFVVVVEELYYVRVVEFVMNVDLFFGVATVNLGYGV